MIDRNRVKIYIKKQIPKYKFCIKCDIFLLTEARAYVFCIIFEFDSEEYEAFVNSMVLCHMLIPKEEDIFMSDTNATGKGFNWRLPAWACHQSASSIISMAMAFASYLATGSYGIAVFTAGLIASGTRIFDAAIDPFLALITDRLSTRFGRVRIMIVVGRAIQILCILGLFFWGIGKGAVVYTVI